MASDAAEWAKAQWREHAERLKAELEAMTEDRNLWRAHAEEGGACPSCNAAVKVEELKTMIRRLRGWLPAAFDDVTPAQWERLKALDKEALELLE